MSVSIRNISSVVVVVATIATEANCTKLFPTGKDVVLSRVDGTVPGGNALASGANESGNRIPIVSLADNAFGHDGCAATANAEGQMVNGEQKRLNDWSTCWVVPGNTDNCPPATCERIFFYNEPKPNEPQLLANLARDWMALAKKCQFRTSGNYPQDLETVGPNVSGDDQQIYQLISGFFDECQECNAIGNDAYVSSLAFHAYGNYDVIQDADKDNEEATFWEKQMYGMVGWIDGVAKHLKSAYPDASGKTRRVLVTEFAAYLPDDFLNDDLTLKDNSPNAQKRFEYMKKNNFFNGFAINAMYKSRATDVDEAFYFATTPSQGPTGAKWVEYGKYYQILDPLNNCQLVAQTSASGVPNPAAAIQLALQH